VIQLTVVGAGPAYSNRPGSAGACYLLRAAGQALVLDLGHGAFAGLVQRIEPVELQAIVVSHLHPDHFIDLVPLRHYLRYQRQPAERVRVVAPRALPERLDGLHGVRGFCGASLDCEALSPGAFRAGAFRLEAVNVLHDGDSYAFRVSVDGSPGPGLVYTGDCGRASDVLPLIRPGDALLSEVSFGPGPGDPHALHLDGPMVGRLAAEGGASRVLLTHLLMGSDRAETIASVRAHFTGRVELVEPGCETDLA
jgi:ribonuclease BN (tRNA processing enzyme)